MKVSLATVNALGEALTELHKRANAADIKVRWLAPASYHVTLKFIGWARPEVIDVIRDKIGEQLAGVSAFRFATKGLGAFPSADKARVVWAGVDNPGNELATLAAKIDGALADLGFPSEKREYRPHVTLGRLSVATAVESVLEWPAEHLFSNSLVESVILYETEMKSGGSEHHVRHVWPLESSSKRSKRQTE